MLSMHHNDRVSLSKAGRLEDTPQGYLWCRDVPLARTGTMDYGVGEVPIAAAPGVRSIVVERTPDEVFSPAAIASFRGMPLTDDHPDDFLTAANHRAHSIGEIHDPRRGEGEHADCLVADLLVKDADAIGLIKSGRKREVSCGYDADYADIRPGYGRQINIRGNHVSLVDAGRAGPRCAIRDRKGPMTDVAPKRSSLSTALRALFGTTDASEREQHFRALDEAVAEPVNPESPTVNVHVHAPDKGDDKPEPKPGDNPNPDEGKDMDEDKITEIVNAAVAKALEAAAEANNAAIAKAVEEATKPLQAKLDETAEKTDAVTEAVEEMADPDDMGMQDAVARAEILAPGLQLPARDAKPGSKAHRDALHGFQREALKRALTTDAGRVAVSAIAGHAQPHRIATMPANEVATVFRGASAILASMNTADTGATLVSATSGYVRDDKGGRVRPMNTADLAQIHRDHYAKRTA